MSSDDSPAGALDDLLARRWSCRAFLPDPVPQPVIERVLETAGRSASWCNTQPWHVHVTSGQGTERLRTGLMEGVTSGFVPEPDFPFPTSYEGVYAERRRASAFELYDSVGIVRGDRAASAQQTALNFTLFGAPHAAIVTTEGALGLYGAVDCGLFVQAFLLAAQAHGLAAIPQAALATQAPFLRELLGLPEARKVLLGISFGYADLSHPSAACRTERQSLTEMTTWLDR